MIYIRPIGGLCNRLRSVDSAIDVAHKHGKKLTILWVLSQDLNARLSDLYDIDELKKHVHHIKEIDPKRSLKEKFAAKVINIIERSKVGTSNKAVNRFLLKLVLADRKVNITFNNLELGAIANSEKGKSISDPKEKEMFLLNQIGEELNHKIQNSESCYIESCYRLDKLNSEIKPYSRFVPVDTIKTRVEQVTSQFENTIGVHIRRTDHHYAIENSPTAVFIKKIREFLSKNDANSVFLCTDDAETREKITNEFPGKIQVIDITSLSRNDPKGIEDAVVDLITLSKTKMILGSHFSSFSETAADIGGIEMETVLKN